MVKIPTRLDDLLPAAAMEKVMQILNQQDLPGSVRDAFNKVGWKDSNPFGQVQEAWQHARQWLDSLTGQTSDSATNARLLNATGQLLHPNFSGVPLAASAAYSYAQTASSFQNSQSIQTKAKQVAAATLKHATAWLNSPQLALQLLQSSSVAPAGIVISRADAVRVPGFGDVRSMLTTCPGRLIEVGAANGATESDWTEAVTSAEQIILLVSPNNLASEVANGQRASAILAAKRTGALVIELLLDGVLSTALSNQYGFANVQQRLANGADAILLPTHFLIAGPLGMIATGSDKLILAINQAAEALNGQMLGAQLATTTLALQLSGHTDEVEAGVASQLLANHENLKNRAHRLAIQLNGTARIREAAAVERECPLGPTPWDRFRLHNWAVRITPRDDVAQLQRELLNRDGELAAATLPIAVAASSSELFVDLRFVPPADDHQIVMAATAGE